MDASMASTSAARGTMAPRHRATAYKIAGLGTFGSFKRSSLSLTFTATQRDGGNR